MSTTAPGLPPNPYNPLAWITAEPEIGEGTWIGAFTLIDGMGQPGMPRRTEADLGYTFDPAYGGRGYATEAVIAMVEHAFGRLGVRRVTAGCYAGNQASVRILEKAGMHREQHGVGDSWHAELGWVDGYTYALLAGDRAVRGPDPRG